ncbi:leukocyte elastase inhibitor-like [Copidosoma floridanum]|uniref:leukocyte elastase inhibitor-like n=1 Tax=Copidosoma floridanum TaxID=29053 RepID=UPI0006C9AAC2|nr:leukocyte elastase inhibitor-like [Copidosoma floridanum]
MRWTGLLLALVVAVGLSECGADIVWPDEYEKLKRVGARKPGKLQGMKLAYNESAQRQIPAAARPTGTLFDTFLPLKWRDHVLNLISRGVAKFTLDMDGAIERTSPGGELGGNLVFSPISLTVTLAMILLASSGQTFQEVVKILGLESGVDITHHSEIVHQMFGLLLQESDRGHLLNTAAPECKFAFGVFVNNGYPVREQFKAVSQKIYKSEIMNVDFARRGREAQVMINQWVSNKTLGNIREILNDQPSPSTAVIILSALYFKGEWNQHFMNPGTKRKPFAVSKNEVIQIDMMFNVGEFPYYENRNLDLKIVGLPYKGLEVMMYAILPINSTTSLKQLKSRLSPEVLNSLIENTTSKQCIVGFPKMKLSNSLELQSALRSLGLNSLFDPATADLSVLSQGVKGDNQQQRPRAKRQQQRPIDEEFVQFLDSANLPNFGVDELRNSAGLRNPHLYADEVFHKVEMTIDETGTEAAAATSVILNRSIDSKRFIADRPFLFFIRHDPTKTIWFWGNILRPDYPTTT